VNLLPVLGLPALPYWPVAAGLVVAYAAYLVLCIALMRRSGTTDHTGLAVGAYLGGVFLFALLASPVRGLPLQLGIPAALVVAVLALLPLGYVYRQDVARTHKASR
jgi:hypothetical protein